MTLKESSAYQFTVKLLPRVRRMESWQQTEAVESMILLLSLLPFAVIGLVWLILESDYDLLFSRLDRVLFFSIAAFLLLSQPFTVRVRLAGSDRELRLTSSLAPVVVWGAALVSGPTGLWIIVLGAAAANIWLGWRIGRYGGSRFWIPFANFVKEMSISLFVVLVALAIYVAFGGKFPLDSTESEVFVSGLVAIAIGALLSGVLLLPAALATERMSDMRSSVKSLGRFYAGAVALPLIMSPFAVLISLLYEEHREIALVFVLIGLYLVNRLAHHMSESEERSRRQARELAQLEFLSGAIIQGPADASTLPELLTTYLPRIFPLDKVEIRLFESEANRVWSPFQLSHPESMTLASDGDWQKMCRNNESHVVLPGVVLPGDNFRYGDGLAVKIVSEQVGGNQDQLTCIGGVYLLRPGLVGESVESLASAQALASQVAAALYRAEVHAETQAFQKAQQELEFAGHIQASFLPSGEPEAENWQLAAELDSARKTSGDFYDFIPLEDGLIGIVVADVSDKGTGAALYMALSRTLIRTYAMEEGGSRPGAALARANDRILTDAESEQFVTLIYGVLDPISGKLTYANAGHNPGYLLRAAGDGEKDGVEILGKTGIPLGMFDGMDWGQEEVQINPGDVLLLYTDGVTEAQNAERVEYNDERLLDTGWANIDRTAAEIQEAIITSIYEFVGDAPQFDDITLLVVANRPATA